MKRIFIGGLILSACVYGLDFVVHGFLLGGLYKETLSVWRPVEDMGKYLGFMYAGQVVFAYGFFILFLKGLSKEKSRIQQGLTFGFLIGVLFGSSNLMWYCVLPIPLELAVKWGVYAVMECSVFGLIAALLSPKN